MRIVCLEFLQPPLDYFLFNHRQSILNVDSDSILCSHNVFYGNVGVAMWHKEQNMGTNFWCEIDKLSRIFLLSKDLHLEFLIFFTKFLKQRNTLKRALGDSLRGSGQIPIVLELEPIIPKQELFFICSQDLSTVSIVCALTYHSLYFVLPKKSVLYFFLKSLVEGEN